MAITFNLHVGFADANGDCTNALDNRGLLFTALDSVGFDGYTVLEGVGCYNGRHEPSAIVTFIFPEGCHGEDDLFRFRAKVKEAALRYKDLASQAEVWITWRDDALEIL